MMSVRTEVRDRVQRRAGILLKELRAAEIETVIPLLPQGGYVLDIGAGTGWQAACLSQAGFRVQAIDIPGSCPNGERLREITEYDGAHIPFPDHTFDAVFSSNVLEHVPHVREYQSEIRRVVKPGGVVIHIVPSSVWRIWTTVGHLLTFSPPTRHGEHASNAFDEVACFRREWWRRLFVEAGWHVSHESSNGIFYTGHLLCGPTLSLGVRRRIGSILGGACHIFVLRP
jgi:SAM-dependent methyltransferase